MPRLLRGRDGRGPSCCVAGSVRRPAAASVLPEAHCRPRPGAPSVCAHGRGLPPSLLVRTRGVRACCSPDAGTCPARFRTTIGQPGDRPDPRRPEGVDLLPADRAHRHLHAGEPLLRLVLRHAPARRRLSACTHGVPPNSNADAGRQRSCRSPTRRTRARPVAACRRTGSSTHRQIDGGRMDGFLFDDNTNAMRYWDGTDLPFYWSLASTFPLVRPLVRVGARADLPEPHVPPGRRRRQDLIATDVAKAFAMPHPAGGTIWDKLNAHGISWLDYAWDLPDIAAVPEGVEREPGQGPGRSTQFLADCHAGTLPSVSIVSPGVAVYTEENPADIQLGEAYSASIINAVMAQPGVAEDGAALHVRRARRLLRPRARRRPRSRPTTSRPASIPLRARPAAWNTYGLRVPAFVISPFAQAQLRVARRARPHVGAAVHRDEVQPRRADPPRCQRVEPARLLRLPARRVPRAAGAGRPRTPGHRELVHARDPSRRRRNPSRPSPQSAPICRPRHLQRARTRPSARIPQKADPDDQRVALLRQLAGTGS